ncbi:MAG: VCBS repeat-containing protein [Pirellulales bacterium]|nr:VCBS repeat-containing protein [Pirellulales bacterium]
MYRSIAVVLTVCCWSAVSAAKAEPPKFKTHRVGTYRSEACGVGDFNNDGKLDIVAGPNIYLAPDWKAWNIRELRGKVDEQGKGYYGDFANLPLDVDGDGKLDVVCCDWFEKCIDWYRNVGPDGGPWPRTVVDVSVNYETADLVDLVGDGKCRQILPHVQPTVWFELVKGPDGKDAFAKHVVSTKAMAFGGGAGDVNGDGRPDLLRPNAWFEAPADPRGGQWVEHPLALGSLDEDKPAHTPQILVCDVNKDGRNDLVTSSAHAYGIFWYEQVREGSETSWKRHLIDDKWTQAHSLTLADIDGDGTDDLVTGKRFMAHNGSDPGEFEPLGVYWYRLERGKEPTWTRHTISYNEGIGSGLNVPVVDLDGDGDLDVVVTGKWGGPVWFENLSK